MSRFLLLSATVLALVACGGGASQTARLGVDDALTRTAESLEFESVDVRRGLFSELIVRSQAQYGLPAADRSAFLLERSGGFVSAPPLDANVDLIGTPDAGFMAPVTLDDAVERWGDEPRELLQSLTEREAAELVARSLLLKWKLSPAEGVRVQRASGAPYAAAYVDGVLRLNPSLLYLAASVGARAP